MNRIARALVTETTLSHISPQHTLQEGRYALTSVHLILNRPPADFVTDQPPKGLSAPETREAWLQTDYSKLIASILKDKFSSMRVKGIEIAVRPHGKSEPGRLHVDPARIDVTATDETGRRHLMAFKNALGNNGVWILNNKDSREWSVRCLHLGEP